MLHILALFFYTGHFAIQLWKRPLYPIWLFALLAAGLALQAASLVQLHYDYVAFGLFQTASLVGFGCVFVAALLYWSAKSSAFLQLWFVPFVCFVLLADLFFDSAYLPAGIGMTGLVIHVLLSVTALSLVSISSVLLFCGLIRDKQLKHISNRQWSIIPAIEVLQKISRNLLLIAWIVLSLATVSGLVFIEDFLAQKLAHKTFFTLLAWLLLSFLVLWLRQHPLIWKRAFILCLLINFSLSLGYFGTRFILEFIVG